MECGICGSNIHNTLDHKEPSEKCRHELIFDNRCLKCNRLIIEDAPKDKKLEPYRYGSMKTPIYNGL